MQQRGDARPSRSTIVRRVRRAVVADLLAVRRDEALPAPEASRRSRAMDREAPRRAPRAAACRVRARAGASPVAARASRLRRMPARNAIGTIAKPRGTGTRTVPREPSLRQRRRRSRAAGARRPRRPHRGRGPSTRRSAGDAARTAARRGTRIATRMTSAENRPDQVEASAAVELSVRARSCFGRSLQSVDGTSSTSRTAVLPDEGQHVCGDDENTRRAVVDSTPDGKASRRCANAPNARPPRAKPAGEEPVVVRFGERPEGPEVADRREQQAGPVLRPAPGGDQAARDEGDAGGERERERRDLVLLVIAREDEQSRADRSRKADGRREQRVFSVSSEQV